MPQVRLAQKVERPTLEAIARAQLQAAEEMGCAVASEAVACAPLLPLPLNDAVALEVQPLCGSACRVCTMPYPLMSELLIGPLFEMRHSGVSLITSSYGSSLRAAFNIIVNQIAVSSMLLPSACGSFFRT